MLRDVLLAMTLGLFLPEGEVMSIMESFRSVIILLRICMSIRWNVFWTHSASWILKLSCFHGVMLSKYIWSNKWDWTKSILGFLMGIILYPWISWLQYPVYYGAIIYALFGMIMVSGIDQFYFWYWDLKSSEVAENYEIQFVDQYKMFPAMPYKYMVLRGVQLSNSFVGFLGKLGYHFFGLFYTLNRIGNNAFIALLILCNTSAITAHSMAPQVHEWKINPSLLTSRYVDFQDELKTSIDRRPSVNLMHDSVCMLSASQEGVILSNQAECEEEIAFHFDTSITEFGTDNCATHHICNDISLYIEPPTPVDNIGIKGVSGRAQASGIGNIKFKLKDDDGKSHSINLNNIIYLPSAPKKLISISQWAEDKGDDCCVTSREHYSIFMWGSDRFKKTIIHSPHCKIPLMLGNKIVDEMDLLASANEREVMGNARCRSIVSDSDKQSDDSDLSKERKIQVGNTVYYNINGKPKVSIVTEAYRL